MSHFPEILFSGGVVESFPGVGPVWFYEESFIPLLFASYGNLLWEKLLINLFASGGGVWVIIKRFCEGRQVHQGLVIGELWEGNYRSSTGAWQPSSLPSIMFQKKCVGEKIAGVLELAI